MSSITIIGGGLAGSEAAWQIAERGINVKLFEMRPNKFTPAHRTDDLAELVCSNSFRANNIDSASGLLKEELRKSNSLVLEAADKNRIPAGGALAVDRLEFQKYITSKISNHPKIQIIRKECSKINTNELTIVATGPLTSNSLYEYIKKLTGIESLYFYDAAAPIVTTESIDMNYAFWQSRYDKGGNDYLNCPLNRDEYYKFVDMLLNSELVNVNETDKELFFEGCMPIEVMAKRGRETLRFGPMKPVGLIDPNTGKEPYAVIQLRKDNNLGSLMNLVGFQTRTKWKDQGRWISSIPALRNSEVVRYGVMHRNTFINSPELMNGECRLIRYPLIYFAGQITGVEGYLESAASGLVVGINATRNILGKNFIEWPKNTAIGSLINHITSANAASFQPMNVNFGLLPTLEHKIKSKKERGKYYSDRSLSSLSEFLESL